MCGEAEPDPRRAVSPLLARDGSLEKERKTHMQISATAKCSNKRSQFALGAVDGLLLMLLETTCAPFRRQQEDLFATKPPFSSINLLVYWPARRSVLFAFPLLRSLALPPLLPLLAVGCHI